MAGTHEAFAGITWMALTGSIGVLLLAATAHGILRWWVRRKVRRDQATPQPADVRQVLHWIDTALTEAVAPLAVLVWIYGGHASVMYLLPDLPLADQAPLVVATLGWIRAVAALATIVWLLVRIGRVAERWITSVASRTPATWDDALLPVAARAIRLFMPLLALFIGTPVLAVSPELQAIVRYAISLLVIGAVAFLLYQLVEAAGTIVLGQYQIDVADNLEARKVFTQITVLKRVAYVVIAIFTLASMLMVFESVRQFGTSILASAGLAGIIIGFAAQRSIATLLAGFQIAITQPIRIDDVVIVEGEWGRIEDITLTYVVVRIWDLRRLVVPITYFIEQPFQNWTRTSADLLGTVFLYVDYTVPLAAVRAELDRVLAASPKWDGKVKGLQVTDSRERTLEIRALASAADASQAWDLRCELREKLVDFLQREYPECLPRLRANLQQSAA